MTSIHELFEAECLDLAALVREELHLGYVEISGAANQQPINLILFSLKHHQIMKIRGNKFEPLQDNDRCNFGSALVADICAPGDVPRALQAPVWIYSRPMPVQGHDWVHLEESLDKLVEDYESTSIMWFHHVASCFIEFSVFSDTSDSGIFEAGGTGGSVTSSISLVS